MPLLIDTFNVLHTTGVLPPEQAGIDVDDLIGLLAVSRYHRQQVTLICDGSGQDFDDPGSCGGVQVRFSGSGRPADDLIIERIARDTAPRQLLIVSTDNEIIRAARRRRCRTLRSATLLHQLATDLERAAHPPSAGRRPKRVAPLPRSEVQRWIEAFELGQQEVEHLASQPPALPPHLQPPAATTSAMDAQEDAQPTATGDEAVGPADPEADLLESIPDALPTDLIAEAEAMLRDTPAFEPPILPPRADHAPADDDVPTAAEPSTENNPDQENDRRDPMHDLVADLPDTDAPRRSARALGHRKLSDLSDDELDAIDMQHLLPDVAPIEDDDDEDDQ